MLISPVLFTLGATLFILNAMLHSDILGMIAGVCFWVGSLILVHKAETERNKGRCTCPDFCPNCGGDIIDDRCKNHECGYRADWDRKFNNG